MTPLPGDELRDNTNNTTVYVVDEVLLDLDRIKLVNAMGQEVLMTRQEWSRQLTNPYSSLTHYRPSTEVRL